MEHFYGNKIWDLYYLDLACLYTLYMFMYTV